MANPFGDFDELEEKETSKTEQKVEPASLNPFGDEEAEDEKTNAAYQTTTSKPTIISPIDETNPFKDDVEADLEMANNSLIFGNISPIKTSAVTKQHQLMSPVSQLPSKATGDTSDFAFSQIDIQDSDDERFASNNFDDYDSTNQDDTLSIGSNNSGGNVSTAFADNLSYFSLGEGTLQKEGLLCPECLQEFRTITELMRHSESNHRSPSKFDNNVGGGSIQGTNVAPLMPSMFFFGASNSLEAGLSGQMSWQIKGLLVKLLKQSAVTDVAEKLAETAKAEDARIQHSTIRDWRLYMKTGPIQSHIDSFRRIRNTRIEGTIFETNKLLIRLDRLLLNCPPSSQVVARREHELSIVGWVDESFVSLCPSCASRFNFLLLKKHHCRLCGGVMCSQCSQFIDFEFAYRLIGPVNANRNAESGIISSGFSGSNTNISPNNRSLTSDAVSNANKSAATMNAMFAAIASPLKAAAAEVVGLQTKAEEKKITNKDFGQIRLCLHCHMLLISRLEKLEGAHCKTQLEILYEQVREKLNEINRLLPVFYKMVDSLYSGENTYNLSDAKELRAKLTKLGEQADIISRKIEQLDLNSKTLSRRRMKIQQSIRRSVVFFMREYLVALPELPDEATLEQLRARHSEIVAARVAYEKALTLREQFHGATQSAEETSNVAGTSVSISLEEGFCLSNPEQLDESLVENEDPILLQMNIIRSYIDKARAEHRYDEVRMLEANLKELEIEYYFNQENKTNQKGQDTSGFGLVESNKQ